jgi:hypothetical protein
MAGSANDKAGAVNQARRSASRTALIEFLIVFVSEICWNFFRKTGQSIFDSFGIAAITAVFLYVWMRERP